MDPVIWSFSANWSLLRRNGGLQPLDLLLCVWLLMETILLWDTMVMASNSSLLTQVCLCARNVK